MNYNVSFKRMYPSDFVEITGKMPCSDFIGGAKEKACYEEIVRKHLLNKPQSVAFVKSGKNIAKEFKLSPKSLLEKFRSILKFWHHLKRN